MRLPRGSLASGPPPGEAMPPDPAFVDAELRPPFPTHRWWSSLVALPFSERQYPHPLAVAARPEGLQVRYPGPDIRANEACICGWMDFEPPHDLILGHSEVARFDAARLAGWSDWFVRARFAARRRLDGGELRPRLADRLRVVPRRRSDRALSGAARGVPRSRRRAGRLPGPALLPARRAAARAGRESGGAELRNSLGGSGRFALALLPDGQRDEAVERFTRAARVPSRTRRSRGRWTRRERASACVFALAARAERARRRSSRSTRTSARRSSTPRRVPSSGTTRPCVAVCRSAKAILSSWSIPSQVCCPRSRCVPGADVDALRALVLRDAAVRLRRARHLLGR